VLGSRGHQSIFSLFLGEGNVVNVVGVSLHFGNLCPRLNIKHPHVVVVAHVNASNILGIGRNRAGSNTSCTTSKLESLHLLTSNWIPSKKCRGRTTLSWNTERTIRWNGKASDIIVVRIQVILLISSFVCSFTSTKVFLTDVCILNYS
jgi:hypothetical protein